MKNETKIDIVQAANKYIADKQLTNTKFANICGVSASYLSNILNGTFTYSSGNSEVEIADKYFTMIAQTVGYNVKKNYWVHVDTREFMEAVSIMTMAKKESAIRTIIMPTGQGKTYTTEKFLRINPLNTYVVVMHSLITIREVFHELAMKLNIPEKGTMGYRRAQVLMKLREIHRNGGNPTVVFDEGENMSDRMFQMMKGFYDYAAGYCSIILIGTHQLFDLMQRARDKDIQSGPQFYRRFKPGIRIIEIEQRKDMRFLPFFDKLGIEDVKLRKLLVEVADNYGELNAYLEPVLKSADKQGVPVTVEFFKLYHGMAA